MHEVIVDETRHKFSIVYHDFIDIYAAKMSASAFKVYMGLMRHANHRTSECYPSRARLAEMLGLSVRTITNSYDELSELGLITVINRNKDHGNKTSSLVTILEPPCKIYPTPLQNLQGTPAEFAAPPLQNLQHNYTEVEQDEQNKTERESAREEKPNRRSQIPDKWMPKGRDDQYGLTLNEYMAEIRKFRQYHSSKGSLYVRWEQAWLTWLDRRKDFSARDQQNGRAENASSEDFFALAEEIRRGNQT